jgi:hypothetical protein
VNPSKIVQIIPAIGWHVSFKQDGRWLRGSRSPTTRVVAFGLREDGKVVPVIADEGDSIVEATTLTNFEHTHYENSPASHA